MNALYYLEKTIKLHTDKVALSDSNGNLTFGKLRQAAFKIAGYLCRRFENNRHNPILVYLPKSKECIVSFLGVAYSGNFYAPTSVNYPFQKVKSVIDALNPSLIITDAANSEKLIQNGISADFIALYDDIINAECEFDSAKMLAKIIDTDPLYVLFTSGSTGIPKGAVISHRSLMSYIDFLIGKFGFDHTMNMASQAPFYFSNSIVDIYACIAIGATLYITPESHFAFPARLMQYIEQNQINFIYWVPSVLISIANMQILDAVDCSCLTKIFFSGEAMPNKQLNYWRKHLSGALYVNLYGSTEITDACTYYIVEREFGDDEPLPIGFPCDNTDIMLLDNENKLITSQDVIGELCVRGTSLSLGYLNNPSKTAGAFVQNPLNKSYAELIYRMGDLAHYNKRGEIMFDGRKDSQIKHLGYRIELGEIETAALGSDKVRRVCALYDTAAGKIVIFYTGSCDEKEMRKHLAQKLPRYMVPAAYHKLDEMPLNDNGKIDRLALKTMY